MQLTDRDVRRISVFLPSLEGGGAEKVMVFLANAFAARGLTIDLVLAKAQGSRRGDVDSAVSVIDLDARRMGQAVIPLMRYLRSARPDALLSALTHANVAAAAAARLSGFGGRVVLSERNSLSHMTSARGWKAGLRLALAKRAYRSSDCVVAVSEELARELAVYLGPAAPDIRAIHNPLDRDAVARSATEDPEVGPFGARGQRILGVGRLTKQKGFDVLLRAFAKMQTVEATLVILGEGPERAGLEALARELGIADRLHMPGFVMNVHAVMARSDIFVLSSRYEGLPNVLLEALACGCHVVSTDCPTGPNEIIRGPDDGALVPVEDELSMARAMERALLHRGRKNADTMLRRFDPDRIVSAYIDALLAPKPIANLVLEAG